MLLQKNLPVRPTYGASDKILKQEGLILADANLAGIAHLVVNLRRTANTVATQGFADGSPVPALVEAIIADNNPETQITLANSLPALNAAISSATANTPGATKDELMAAAIAAVDTAGLLEHYTAARELEVPNRRQRGFERMTVRLNDGVSFFSNLLEEASAALEGIMAGGGVGVQDVDAVYRAIIGYDILTVLDSPDMSNRFTIDRLQSATTRDRQDVYVVELTTVLVQIGMAIQQTLDTTRLRSVCKWLLHPSVWANVEREYGHTNDLFDAAGNAIAAIDHLRRACEWVVSQPVSSTMAEIMATLEPSVVNSLYGPMTCFFRDSRLEGMTIAEAGTITVAPTTAADVGLGFGPNQVSRYTTNLLPSVSIQLQDVLNVYQRWARRPSIQENLSAGQSILGMVPVPNKPMWNDFYETSPVLYTRTSLSSPMTSPVELAFSVRMPAYDDDNPWGTTRNDGVATFQRNGNMHTVGQRWTVSAEVHYELWEPMTLAVIPEQEGFVLAQFSRDDDWATFRPRSEWRGEQGSSFKERVITLAAMARSAGISQEEVITRITDGTNVSADYNHLFDLDDAGVPVLRDQVNPAWRSWIEEQDESMVVEMEIPYYGPRTPIVRVDTNSWLDLTSVSLFEETFEEESLPFETLNLARLGSSKS